MNYRRRRDTLMEVSNAMGCRRRLSRHNLRLRLEDYLQDGPFEFLSAP